ncbi:hypothetical protein [Chryseobacterium wanjuense]
MKKHLLTIFILTIGTITFGQVGFNTFNPTSTVDIRAKFSSGGFTNVDGLLIPRVDRMRAQNMINTPTSTLIYVNSISTGSQAGTAINIDDIGFYYFDGSVWQKFTTAVTEAKKIYALLGVPSGQTWQSPFTDIPWVNQGGINANLISISATGGITLPPNRTFLLECNINWLLTSTLPDGQWLKYRFVPNFTNAVNIAGYQESSTETANDGGVIPAKLIIKTSNVPQEIKVYGNAPLDPSTNIYRFNSNTLSPDKGSGTYLLIQEL